MTKHLIAIKNILEKYNDISKKRGQICSLLEIEECHKYSNDLKYDNTEYFYKMNGIEMCLAELSVRLLPKKYYLYIEKVTENSDIYYKCKKYSGKIEYPIYKIIDESGKAI